MANEFKIKHGFISTGNGTVEGEVRITGAAYADNNSRLATRPWVTQFLADNNYLISNDLPTNVSAFTNDANYLTSIPSEYVTEGEGDARYAPISHSHNYLPLSGGTLTGTLTLSAVNPRIDFNGTSDASVDMAIVATPEGLDFLEPEDGNKVHFQILDDAGVNSPYGYKWNGQSLDVRYAAASHTHSIDQIDGLQTELDGKQPIGNYLTSLPSHNHNDLYFTEAESDARYVKLSGSTMGGDVTWTSTGRGLQWTMNTDGAYIRFYNTGDADTDSRLEYGTTDNGNEYHRFMVAGIERMAITAGGISATGYNKSNWDTAFGWGNHVGLYDALGSAAAVDQRINDDVLPNIPTNNNQLTNGAGYITDGNTGWNNSYGFITASDSITGNAATATKLATARNIALSGAVTGNANFDGSGNITISTTATSDPTLTLNGDASGSATFTNLGNATLTVTVANDSHTHDGRYYTESESDARFVNVTGDTITGDLFVSGASLGVTSTAQGTEAFFVDGVNGRLFTISDDLSDSLFSVNTISGLPVIEAFADNTVKIGPFSNPVTIDSSGVLAIGGITAATQTYVDTAITNLIGGAPGALDTLNELAAAINDNASYATSVTNALALKAPLASPALTGTPTAPTAATATNNTQVATTAYVKAQGYVTTDTNYYLNGISRSGNVLTFSVAGATNQTYTFGSAAWAATTAFDAAGSANEVNNRIDNEVLPLISTPAITSNGSTPALNTGISAAEIRTLIGAGTSSSDTNFYVDGLSFDTGNGILTASVSGATNQTVDLDGRYQLAGSYLTTSGKAADSNLLDGLDLHTGRNNEANKVVRTDGNGYIQAGWINTPSGTAGTINKIYCSQDDYVRYLTPANFRTQVTDGSYDALGAAEAVNSRIDTEVLPSIPTNNNQLTNGAGYITDGNTNWNNNYGFITASSNITGTSAGVVRTVSGTSSAELVRGNMGDNDQARILVGASASNAGYLEIATADDGTEPIFVRQYTGVFSTLQRTATLLDASGNTSFPGNVTGANLNITNWDTAYGWGNHASAGYLTSVPAEYLTDGEGDGRYLGITAKAADSNLLDGIDSSAFLRSNANDTATGVISFNAGINTLSINDTSGQQLVICAGEAGIDASQNGELVYVNAENGFQVAASNDNWATGYAGTKKTIIDYNGIRYDGNTVWHTGNFNPGSYQSAGTYNTIIGTDSDLNTSGSTIIDNIYVTDGVITSMGTRTLTAADLGVSKPAPPAFGAANIVGETIEVVFDKSPTSGVDAYQVWSSVDGGSYGLIANIPTQDIAVTMTAIDAVFSVSGTISYRVYAIKNGIYSDPAEGGTAYTASGLDVVNMSVVNLNTAYYIQYDMPDSRFVDHIEIYMDAETSSGNLSRTGATLIYSGNNTSYMYQIGASDLNKYHQFWVEVIES